MAADLFYEYFIMSLLLTEYVLPMVDVEIVHKYIKYKLK